MQYSIPTLVKKVALKYLIISLLVFLQSISFAQKNKIDSLINHLNQTLEDTARIESMNRLTTEYNNAGDYQKAMTTADSAQKLAKKYLLAEHPIKEKKIMTRELGVADCNVGVIFRNQGNFPKALESYFKALKLYEDEQKKDTSDIDCKKGISFSLNNIGNIYMNQLEYEKALENYFRALKISQQANDLNGTAKCMNNIGVAYSNMNKFPEAREQFVNSLNIKLQLFEKIKTSGNSIDIRDSRKGIAYAYNNIGTVYMREGETAINSGKLDSISNKFAMALQYYFKSMKMREEVNDVKGMMISMGNIGDVYEWEGDSAIKTGNKNLAILFFKKALDFHVRVFSLANKKGIEDIERDASQSISAEYEKMNKMDSALKYYKHYISLRDTLLNVENTRKTVETEMNFEFEKKSAIEKAEQEKKDGIATEKLDAETRQRNYFVAGFGIMLILSGFIFRSYRQKKKANEIIAHQKILVEEKQKEVMDSIHYAKRIQESLLPTEKYIDKNLERLKKN